jgi:hypothetical protein
MRSLDIPQANALETVRQVVKAIDLGVKTAEAIADYTGFSFRHAGYRLHAARILGLIRQEGDESALTPLGERLVAAEPRSEIERSVFYDAIQGSAVIQLLVPDLLSLVPPESEVIADRLFQESKLSRTTSLRRAGGLLSWRRYVFGDDAETRRRRSSRADKVEANEPVQLSLF